MGALTGFCAIIGAPTILRTPVTTSQWTRSVGARLVARERYCFLAGPMRVGKHSCVDCVSPAALYRYLPLRAQLAAGRPDFVRHLRFLPRALGESFRADDRGRFAQATPQALRECQKSCAPGRLGAIVHAHAGARCKDREPQRHMTASRQEPTARVRQRIFSAASASVPERRALGLD